MFDTLATFGVVLALAVALHWVWISTLFTIAGTRAGESPVGLVRNMLPAYFTALGTMSSAATIPVTMQSARNNGVREHIADFTIPLCATVHLSGSTITIVSCAIAVTVLQEGLAMPGLFDILPFIMMLGVVMMAAPGVPGGAVMAAVGLLDALPVAAVQLVLLTGCGDEAPAPPDAAESPQSEPLAFELVGQGLRADVQDTLEVVIRDSSRWAEIRDQLRPAQPFGRVDFDETMVLFVALPVPSGGYDLRFEAVERTDAGVVAEYLFAEPGDDCMTALGRSVPFQAVAVPRAEGPVRFVRRHDTYPCTTDTGF